MRIVQAAAVALVLCAAAAAANEQTEGRTHTVTIEGMRFQPDVLTVASGDTIVWINRDLVPHTATSKAGRFDSKMIQADESWTLTAGAKGDFSYLCTFHPAMKATLLVR